MSFRGTFGDVEKNRRNRRKNNPQNRRNQRDEVDEKIDEIDKKIDEVEDIDEKIDEKRRNRRNKATIDKIDEKIDDDFVVFVKPGGRHFLGPFSVTFAGPPCEGAGAGSGSGWDSGTTRWRAVWCDKDTKGRERAGKGGGWVLGSPPRGFGTCRSCNAKENFFSQ